MSANYEMKERPAKWISAHRKNEFKYQLPETFATSIYDASGFAKMNLSSAFPFPIEAGDRIYLDYPSTVYNGYHTIRTVHSSVQITLETAFISTLGGSIRTWLVALPGVSIYKGYADGELILPLYPSGTVDLFDIMPRTLIAEFQPESGPDGYVRFDISGYVKAALESPYRAGYNEDETDYHYAKSATEKWLPKQYQKIEVVIEGNVECVLYAANAGISTQELNRYYVSNYRQLQPLKMPVLMPDGSETGDYILGNYLTRY